MAPQEFIIERIKELMKCYGMTVSELGRRTGMSQSNLTQILKGKRPCGEGVITKIAVGMGVNKDWLLGRSEEMQASALETRPHVPFEVFAGRMGGHDMGNPTTAIYIDYDRTKVDEANRRVIDWVLYSKR